MKDFPNVRNTTHWGFTANSFDLSLVWYKCFESPRKHTKKEFGSPAYGPYRLRAQRSEERRREAIVPVVLVPGTAPGKVMTTSENNIDAKKCRMGCISLDRTLL
jgi:hypothetical protein